MDILIFSDSHGDTAGIRQMLRQQIHRPDAIFFLGDGLRDTDQLSPIDPSLYRVYGNCDWFSAEEAPFEIVMALGGHVIFATHGHLYHAKETEHALLAHAAEVGADIVLFGHTHMPTLKVIPAGTAFASITRGTVTCPHPIYLFNPGSLRAGSFGTLTIQSEQLLFAHGTL
jgi:putative phosphoesterase